METLKKIYTKMKHLIKLFLFYLLPAHLRDIDFLVVITGQACSLKCRKCANFSPWLSHKYPFYNYTDIINDIEILLKRIRKIKKLQIQGGEFFLHPNAIELIKYVKNNHAISSATIATNGTIIPSKPVLDELRDSKIRVRISNYPPPPPVKQIYCFNIKNRKIA